MKKSITIPAVLLSFMAVINTINGGDLSGLRKNTSKNKLVNCEIKFNGVRKQTITRNLKDRTLEESQSYGISVLEHSVNDDNFCTEGVMPPSSININQKYKPNSHTQRK